jgi:hypothetical protein
MLFTLGPIRSLPGGIDQATQAVMTPPGFILRTKVIHEGTSDLELSVVSVVSVRR